MKKWEGGEMYIFGTLLMRGACVWQLLAGLLFCWAFLQCTSLGPTSLNRGQAPR